MSAQKNAQKNLDPTDTFDENPGIKQRFILQYPSTQPLPEELPSPSHPDPVKVYKYETKHPPKEPATPTKTKDDTLIEPSVSVRLGLIPEPGGEAGVKYQAKDTRSMKALKHKNRMEQFYNKVSFCDFEVLRLPSPIVIDTISMIEEESPTVSKAKVLPEKPSLMTSSDFLPPRKSSLKKRMVRSGIFINEPESEDSVIEDEEEKKPKKKQKKEMHISPAEAERRKFEEIINAVTEKHEKEKKKGDGPGVYRIDNSTIITEKQIYWKPKYRKSQGKPIALAMSPSEMERRIFEEEMHEMGAEEGDGPGIYYVDSSTHVSDNLIIGQVKDIMSQASSATSMQDKSEYDDLSWCEIPLTSRLVQTLRDAQCVVPKQKYRKGCLENHSFTKLKQHVPVDFPHYTVCGTIHQGDFCFPKISRSNQGMCMPITAFCYGQLCKPRTWDSRCIDEIIEIGNCHFLNSIAELHLQQNRKEIAASEIHNFVCIGEKKVKFEVTEPVVKGQARSTDKRIFNIISGLSVFFCRYKAALFRTEDLNLLLWKLSRKCFLVFDAGARKGNLTQDKNGTAVMTMVRKVKAIAAILLDRSNIGNSAFSISEIKLLRIMKKDDREDEEYCKQRNTFININDRQAVVQGSFDLGDLCFLFNRNKQSLSMSVVALAYSRISAPNCWHKKTLDKILIIGNQLHALIAEAERCPNVGIEHLPAVFTVGPYVLEMHVYPNRHADLMYKKSTCMFSECLAKFFEDNNNCIAQIGKAYLAIWQQRDLYFSFDPHTRNKEGLTCRKGAACVTMNKDLDTLAETVLANFDNRDAIFHLHAVKLIRIYRDPELSKFFPRYMTLHEVALETFHKHKCMKSRKRAVEKPFATADFGEHALKKLLQAADSVYDVQSNLGSIGTNALPCIDCPKLMRTPRPKIRQPDEEAWIVDLDSPSLSDTQIVPKRPGPYDDEINIDDLASFGLTQEEKELEEEPEGQEGVRTHIFGEDYGESDFGDEEDSHYGGVMSQVTSGELDPCFRADYVNTDLTYCYKLLPAMELPMKTKDDREIEIDKHHQDKEMEKMREFDPLSETTQILRGVSNAFDLQENDDPNLLIPYMCIMAAAYDLEKPIYRWDKATLGFIVKGGRVLFDQNGESFVHIDDFRFEFKRVHTLATVDIIFNTYIGDDLFDTFAGQKVIEDFIHKHVFSRQDSGFVIVPHYACTVFFKKNLFYLFDPHNCDANGNVRPNGATGKACVMRFRNMDLLVRQLVHNLTKRVQENDPSGTQFRMLILAKPKFTDLLAEEKRPSTVKGGDEKGLRTQSEEFKRPNNFIKLPDGSHLIRGTKHVGELGDDVEFIAPYIAIMAAAVGYKYNVRTWSAAVLDFVLSAGNALYHKSKYPFVQLAKLDLPQMSLGRDDLQVQVRFAFDAPIELGIIKTAALKVIQGERNWVFIVTEVYTCALCQRNGIFYMYTPFACNELGLDDVAGYSSMARFRSLDDLCMRFVHNKAKRDLPEQGAYTRFALYICRVSRQPKAADRKKKYPGDDLEEEMNRMATDPEDGMEEEEEEEDDEGKTRPVKHGYYKVTNVEVIEGSKALKRPGSDQVALGVDHFATLAAALMVIHKPLEGWTKKNVDKALDIGREIYNHADSLEQASRRTIRNILVGRYFFDVIVKTINIEAYRNRTMFTRALNYVLRRRRFVILQTGEGTYVIYIDGTHIHLFHAYAATFKGGKDNERDHDVSNACWIKFKNVQQMRKFLAEANNMQRFSFYTFLVINVTKAPRSVVVSSMIQDWIRAKQTKGEPTGKSFHEHESWMDMHDNPWARLGPKVDPATKAENGKWFAWDVEYQNDLYMLCGAMNLHDRCFHMPHKGKQTLCTLVALIGMTGIYDLKEWNGSVVDAVMVNGYKYHVKCVEPISEENHEIGMDDLLPECEIFPFKFTVRHQPVVEGTLFLVSPKRFNLYRALRFFFDDYYYRAGIVVCERNDVRKMVAFAKRKDNEYYMFDCSTFGKPMFAPHEGVPYLLRCTTLARLIHILVLTLRGGTFFIYEVIADRYTAMEEGLNPYVEEKPKLKT